MEWVERWQRTWSHLGDAMPEGLLAELLAAYAEPHRAYHTDQHLRECFEHLDSSPLAPEEPASVELALWFHDAIYDTKAPDNEEKSAEWARAALAGLSAELLDRVERLVLVTKHDAEPETQDERLLLDVDLSILGASPARFEEYEAQVRREYEWVPEAAYRAGRGKILREFAGRERLYHTSHFFDALERSARVNLQKSITLLLD